MPPSNKKSHPFTCLTPVSMFAVFDTVHTPRNKPLMSGWILLPLIGLAVTMMVPVGKEPMGSDSIRQDIAAME